MARGPLMLRSLGLAHKEGRSLRLRKANSPPCSTAGGGSRSIPGLPPPLPHPLQYCRVGTLQYCRGAGLRGVKIIRRLAAL